MCYGCLEILRAMQIVLRIDSNKAMYEISDLGKFIFQKKFISLPFELKKCFISLTSIKTLLKFIDKYKEVDKNDISAKLGEEMKYYNKMVIAKELKKPFNPPVSQAILDLLEDFCVINKNPNTKKYFVDEY